ncbi:pyridine nucleotide-disulfide oxidoreductase domain-containing protein 2 [Planoprotostelium fungivorum]|uniref:Pyridine nucleotide-disulfide oxidoreductase domain-containing protein 2 n=1 Tax=Planoprotostelium fungivorum TaxID=1890364 RepID=A0A2P6NK06_9EUKA|nr:pyridine nucleotide-disulfide oxidoreductase domain-containing protein 2 [Planoprotostelium fungivorum]
MRPRSVPVRQERKNKKHTPCKRCGTKKTTSWRTGPDGPSTLCNACGVHWFRGRKRETCEEICDEDIPASCPPKMTMMIPTDDIKKELLLSQDVIKLEAVDWATFRKPHSNYSNTTGSSSFQLMPIIKTEPFSKVEDEHEPPPHRDEEKNPWWPATQEMLLYAYGVVPLTDFDESLYSSILSAEDLQRSIVSRILILVALPNRHQPIRFKNYIPNTDTRDGPAIYDEAKLQPYDFDITIVGAGHNGLVTASYLAREGYNVGVFERRHVVGGAAVTEEIFPGYKFSRASYLCSLLHSDIIEDMKLIEKGLTFLVRNPSSFTPTDDGSGRYLLLGTDGEENLKQIASLSQKDSEKFPQYEQHLEEIIELIEPLLLEKPLDVFHKPSSGFDKLARLSQLLRMWINMKPRSLDRLSSLYNLMTTPAKTILDRWFENEILKATLATDAVIGSTNGVDQIGSGYVLLHHVMGSINGHRGRWAYVKGGMGKISELMANDACAHGASIYTSTPVKSIDTEGGKTNGITLEDGRKVRSKVVISNATPHVTFNKLMAETKFEENFKEDISRIDYTSGVVKINIAMNEIPNFKVIPNEKKGQPGPQHRGTIHFVRNMKDIIDALADFQKGEMSKRPVIEMTIPSVLDDSLAPSGHHVASLFCQYAPYHLKGQPWTKADREEFCNRVFNVIEGYAPGFKQSVIHKEVLTPSDLEKVFGITGGNIFHGAMSLSQLYMSRPIPRYSDYTTPIEGLYMCGSGSHPGGGVSGLPGRNCAFSILDKLPKPTLKSIL